MANDWHDPTYGSIDRDIQEYLEANYLGSTPSQRHIAGLNLQQARNKGETVLDVEQDPRVGLVKILLSSSAATQPGDENTVGLTAAFSPIGPELRKDITAAFYCAALERLEAAANAETLAVHIPVDEFRTRALERAEYLARLWREAVGLL